MAAEHHINNETKIILTRWEGDVTQEDFIEALKNYQKNIQCKAEYLEYNEVFDVSNAAMINLTISGLLAIGRTASKTDHLFSCKKLALIVGTAKAFTLARMYQIYRNMGVSSCKEIRVFKSKNEAVAWAKSST